MRYAYLLAFAAMCPLLGYSALAQNSPAAAATSPAATTSPTPPERIFHYSVKGRLLKSADGADHREEFVYHDSIGGTLRVYYPSGKLRRTTSYLHFKHGIKYGLEAGFYETGEIKSRRAFQVQQVGPFEQFYRNGKVRIRVPLGNGPDGNPLPAELFLPDGKPAPAAGFVNEKMPLLNGVGNQAIIAAVQRRTRYPVEALRNQLTGTVLVGFIVDDAGFIRDAHIELTPSPVFNATVLDAVRALGRLTPGEVDGDTVEVSFMVPITFSIQ